MNKFSIHTVPSIFFQRIVLISFLVIMGIVVWWQQAGGSLNQPVQKFSKTSVPDVVAELNFTNAEAAWNDLQFDSQGKLKIDRLTETALVDSIDLMNGKDYEQRMERIALLLEKQFGETGSQEVMALLPILKNYKEIEQRWWQEKSGNEISSDEPPDYAELFQTQDELLGETRAKLMFSEQRRLIKMMLASYEVQNDQSLTQTEKDLALSELSQAFQEAAPNE